MNRNVFFKNVGLGVIGIIPFAQTDGATNVRKPNVVFILADDWGWMDAQCYGSSFYETPNIDRFAKEGVRFTNAYAACHVSSPTRGSILSGQYPARTHLSDWLPGRKDYPFQKLKNAVSAQHLPYGENSTFPAVMQANGYKTALIGKWHLGEDSATCERQGFDLHIPSGWLKGWPANSYFSPYQMPGLKDGPEGEYLTDRLTDEALQFMDENKNKPFLLYLSHYAVHDPIQGRPDLVKKYQDKLAKMQRSSGNPFILEGNPDDPSQLTREELDKLLNSPEYKGFSVLPNNMVKIKQFQDNVQFAAMVESVDESVGRVLKKLKELGLEKNTIVIFYADNGGMSAANFGNPGRLISVNKLDQSFSTSNLPLRGGKGWLYEGGIREPLIVKWPQQGKKGIVCNVPVTSVDFYPSILEMTGLKMSSVKHVLDGMSITPLLKADKKKQASLEKRAIFWHFPHYSNHGMQSPGGAVRLGDYKLLDYLENNTVQLFNLAKDPGEQNDLSKKEPGKVKELKALLDKWRKDVKADMMSPNPDYRQDAKPKDFTSVKKIIK
ncbi:MAG: sulfatase [Bacteroidales bacterium]